MQLDSRKIQTPNGYKKEDSKDGSVRFVKYKTQATKNDLVQFRQSYGTNYNLQINLPPERELDTVIIVSRSSVNCYRVIISTSKHTKLINCKTYDEINQCIHSHAK